MDPRGNLSFENWTECSMGNETSKSSSLCNQAFTQWEDSATLDYNIGMKSHNTEFKKPFESLSSHLQTSDYQSNDPLDGQANSKQIATGCQDWDPQSVLSNLGFLEQMIHQLQNMVHLIVGQNERVVGQPNELVAQQQQLVSDDLTSIIVQLISIAGSLLPNVKNSSSSISTVGGPSNVSMNDALQQSKVVSKVQCQSDEPFHQQIHAGRHPYVSFSNTEDHETKDEEDTGEGENLPPGSYVVLQLEKDEILAPHRHFCLICGKGFKRDANLRMHMRGHGDEYKTPAALAKPPPNEESSSEPTLLKRYSCPYVGCKRNKEHKKFQPLKTILSVKNHYKRTHCDKSYTCSRCNTKKFSVIADLKTHEKHCGSDKWLCSCGTTFSRKDKLFGHVALFQGHTPALPVEDTKMDGGESNEETTSVASMGFNVGTISNVNGAGMKGNADLISLHWVSTLVTLAVLMISLNHHLNFQKARYPPAFFPSPITTCRKPQLGLSSDAY